MAASQWLLANGCMGLECLEVLREAKYINLSLHFLEQVIVALHDRSRGSLAR